MVTAVPVCSRDDLAGPLRQALAGQHFACADDVAVCEGSPSRRRLVGVIPVERLLGARDDEAAEDLMDRDPPVVAPGLDQERAAWKAVQHG